MPIDIQGDASFKEYSLCVACLASFDWVKFGDHASADKYGRSIYHLVKIITFFAPHTRAYDLCLVLFTG